MKTKNQSKFIVHMYRLFTVVFWLHLLLVLFILLFNYFTIDDGQLTYTVRGHFNLYEKNMPPTNSYLATSQNGLQSIVLLYKTGFARFDYTHLKEGFTAVNLFITFLSFSVWLVSLLFTFHLMKIFQSLEKNKVFEMENIRRLRIIAAVIALVPLLHQLYQVVFSSVAARLLNIPNHVITGVPADFKFLPLLLNHAVLLGFLVMLLVLVLTQIFLYGLALKTENDLTI